MPTRSSLSKSLKSIASSWLSSPPNTRWSNCLGVVSAMARLSHRPDPAFRLGEISLSPYQAEHGGRASRSGGEQGTMHRKGFVVERRPPVNVGEHGAGFVHQKVGGRK